MFVKCKLLFVIAILPNLITPELKINTYTIYFISVVKEMKIQKYQNVELKIHNMQFVLVFKQLSQNPWYGIFFTILLAQNLYLKHILGWIEIYTHCPPLSVICRTWHIPVLYIK